jgi:midasin
VLQQLANMLGQTLVVQNLNVQSDSTDLLGGYKPVEMRQVARPLYNTFLSLFPRLFSRKANKEFLKAVKVSFEKKQWQRFSQGI